MSSKCNNFASEEALKIAKTNVEKYYAVVGILERWQDSLQLLEVGPCPFIQISSQFYPSFCPDKITVFPRIVSAETILFWEVEVRQLFKGGNYSRAETIVFLQFCKHS